MQRFDDVDKAALECIDSARRLSGILSSTLGRIRELDPQNIEQYAIPNTSDVTLFDISSSVISVVTAIRVSLRGIKKSEKLFPLSVKTGIIATLQRTQSALSNFTDALTHGFGSGGNDNSIKQISEKFVYLLSDDTLIDLNGHLREVGSSIDSLKNLIVPISAFAGEKNFNDLSEVVLKFNNELDQIKSTTEKLKHSEEKIIQIIIDSEELLQKTKQGAKSLDEMESSSVDRFLKIEEKKEAAESAVSEVEQILARSRELKAAVDEQDALLKAFVENVDRREKLIQDSEERIKKILLSYDSSREQIDELIEKSKKLHSSVTAGSLGAAFFAEAKTRWIASLVSAGILMCSLAGMAYLVMNTFNYLGPMSEWNLDKLPGVFFKLSALIPAIIAARVAAKNLAISRLMVEEYSHRGSISVALEGFRHLVAEPRQEELAVITLQNLQANPARRLDPGSSEANVLDGLKGLLPWGKDKDVEGKQ